jgi:hypothetical protein
MIGNKIYDNNLPNPVMGGLVGQLPTGIGTLLIGVDNVLMLKNEITDNGFAGIAIVDWCDFNDCVADPPVDGDPKPNNNSIIRNTATNNGLCPDPANGGGVTCPAPVPGHTVPNPFAFLAADILRFAPGSVGNCFSDNVTGPKGTNPNPLTPEC